MSKSVLKITIKVRVARSEYDEAKKAIEDFLDQLVDDEKIDGRGIKSYSIVEDRDDATIITMRGKK